MRRGLPTSMDLRLVITVPGQAPATFVLKQGSSYTLGRSSSADIVIPSAYVSRTPIRVEWTGFGFDIVDSANRNPIVLNGYPLSGRGQIRQNDLITIGDVTIAVEKVEDAEGTILVPPGAPPAVAAPSDVSFGTVVPQPAAPAGAAAAAAAAPPAGTGPATPGPAAPPAPAAAPVPPGGAPARPPGTDYGALRVRRADGGTNEYRIESKTVVVGRAGSANIAIEDDITIDRRHFQLKIEDGYVTIEDLGSAGGTFLGSQRLRPNTVHRLAERQIIRFGNCEAELLPPGRSQSGRERPTTTTLSLAPPVQPISAGGTGTATITVQNRGRVVDQISLRVPDLDPTWVEVRRPTISLVPGARDEVTIVFKPPKSPAATAGEHPFAVSAISAESGSEVRALGRFTILPFEALDLSLRPKGKKGRFTITIRNGGNAPSVHELSLTDEEEALKYELETERVELEPGEEKSIALRVKPKRKNPFGQHRQYRFVLEARPVGSGTTRAVANGNYMYRAPFRNWRAWLFPLLTALGLGTVLIFARGNPATIIRWFDFGGDSKPAATRTAAPTQPATQGPTSAATTPAQPTAASCNELAAGCEAVVINSPGAPSCLRVRVAPTTSAQDIQSGFRLCDGARVRLTGTPTDADGYRWWPVELSDGRTGFVAERELNATGDPKDIGPWIQVVN